MAGSYEPFPGSRGSVAAFLGVEDHVAYIDGEKKQFTDPGDFPAILDAFFYNRRCVVIENNLHVRAYQKYLETYPLGLEIAGALNVAFEEEEMVSLLGQLELSASEGGDPRYYYAEIIDKVAEHLPENVDPDVLRWPWH